MAEGWLFVKEKHHYMLYRPKWDLDCSQKRLPIKLKNKAWGRATVTYRKIKKRHLKAPV
jgi:hypothetical protein